MRSISKEVESILDELTNALPHCEDNPWVTTHIEVAREKCEALLKLLRKPRVFLPAVTHMESPAFTPDPTHPLDGPALVRPDGIYKAPPRGYLASGISWQGGGGPLAGQPCQHSWVDGKVGPLHKANRHVSDAELARDGFDHWPVVHQGAEFRHCLWCREVEWIVPLEQVMADLDIKPRPAGRE